MLMLVVALPSAALARGPDAGSAKEAPAPASEGPVARARWGKERGTREQAKFALMIVLSAVGVYGVYRLIRR